MTPRVTFYDVPAEGRWPLVVRMAEAAMRKRKRFLVHCADPAEARALDAYLWTFRDEAFLPHEIADGAEDLVDAEAQVVIVTREVRPIPATVLLQLTPASEAFARTFESVIEVLDHRDAALVAASRERYRVWRDSGVPLEFKKQ